MAGARHARRGRAVALDGGGSGHGARFSQFEPAGPWGSTRRVGSPGSVTATRARRWRAKVPGRRSAALPLRRLARARVRARRPARSTSATTSSPRRGPGAHSPAGCELQLRGQTGRDVRPRTTCARTTSCSSPATRPGAPFDFSIRASAGSFHYYCELHGSRSGGMSGWSRASARFRIPQSRRRSLAVGGPRPNTGTRFDVRYGPGSDRRWKTWKNDTPRCRAVRAATTRHVKPDRPTRSRCASAGRWN